jgi:hypothetical protein
MKKITLRLFAFIAVALFSYQAQAQGNRFPTDPAAQGGPFLIKVEGQDLYLTLPDEEPPVFGSFTQTLTYQPLNTANPELQQFSVSPVPADAPIGQFFYIESVIAGRGLVELTDRTDTTSPLGVQGNVASSPDPDGLDVWNPSRGSGTQLFNWNNCGDCAFTGLSRRRVQDNSGDSPFAGSEVSVNGGAAVTFTWEAVVLSNEDFNVSSVFISNPVNNQLTISGLTPNVKDIAVYSLLGKQVLAVQLNGETSLSLDTSALASGIYVVEMKGENASVSKKIVKQ